MKINELKNPKSYVDEGLLDAIGPMGAGAIRSLGTPGMTTLAQMTQDKFIKDFVGNAVASITSAVKSKVINPDRNAPSALEKKKSDSPPGVGGHGPNIQQPSTESTIVPPKNPKQKPPHSLNSYNWDIEHEHFRYPVRVNERNVSPIIRSLRVDLNRLAEGDNEGRIAAVNKILNFATADRQNNRYFLTQSICLEISKMLNEYRLTWTNLGLRARLYESSGNSIACLSRCTPSPVTTEEFKKLNRIFENIMNVDEDEQQNTTSNQKLNISDFVNLWLDRYMQGVLWKSRYQAQVEPLIHAIQAGYPGNIKQTLTQLATAMFAASATSHTVPQGFQNVIDTKSEKDDEEI